MPDNGMFPSLLKLYVNAHGPALIRAKSVYSTLIKSCHLIRLTLLSHCKHCMPSRTIAMRCQSQWSTERSVCGALWWGEQCPYAGVTLSDRHVHVVTTTNDTHWPPLCVNNVNNVLCPLRLIVPPSPRSRMRDYKRSRLYSPFQ